MVSKRRVIWPQIAKQQLREIYDHIKEESLKNADKVRRAIVTASVELPGAPGRYNPDKFKKNNDGSFRAFELYHIRIAYQVTEKEIIIVRVRHTSMEPAVY